jgi:hypothetical protein
MDQEPKDQEPTQSTPTGHKIPVPTRKDVFRDLAKVAKPRTPLPPTESGPED